MKPFIICSLAFFAYHVVALFYCLTLFDHISYLVSFCMFKFMGLDLSFVLSMDLFSCMFSSFVALITGVVISYSYYYMEGDVNMKRFYILLILFVFSMFMLIHTSNLLFIMIGWDGLGLTSFCLIIYYGGPSVQRSGLVSIYLNRMGDMGLIVCIFLLMDIGFMGSGMAWLIEGKLFFYLFALSCITKSAQYPFSSWLPAAMSAPTPISSLVHSSTLVTAGIYLLIRFSPLFFFLYDSFLFVFLSLLTMTLAGFLAVLERDLKKVIAMSTLSQLGLMMYMLSLGEKVYCFFHLITHAIFKSLLFMSCGGLLLMTGGNQDYRMKSGSVFLSPLLSFYFSACSLSLGGLTFLSGFFSKDLCLDSIHELNSGFFFTMIFYVGCLLTLIYSGQLFFSGLSSSSFISPSLGSSVSYEYCFPHLVLFIMSSVLGKFIFFVFFLEEFDFSFSLMKLLGLLLFLVGWLIYISLKLFFLVGSLKDYMSKMFFLDYVFGYYSSKVVKIFEDTDSFDLTWMENISVKMLSDGLIGLSQWLIIYFLKSNSKVIFMVAVYILVISFLFM